MICKTADEVLKQNTDKKDYSLWSMGDLHTVIKPVKVAVDGKLPSKKRTCWIFGTPSSTKCVLCLAMQLFQ
jgi:hypothetical protein